MPEYAEQYIDGKLGKIDTAFLGRIERIDDDNFIHVSPLAAVNDTELPKIPAVPLMQFGNSNFNIKIQSQIGDVVLVITCSRDVTNFLVSESIVANTNKRHNLNNSIAIPLLLTTKINPVNTVTAIEITGDVKINGNLSVSGESTAADHISSGVSGKDHLHSGVTTGSDKTQKPE